MRLPKSSARVATAAGGGRGRGRQRLIVPCLLLLLSRAAAAAGGTELAPAPAPVEEPAAVTYLSNDDFAHGTYVITKPGKYILAKDMTFELNSVRHLGPDVVSASDVAGCCKPLPRQLTSNSNGG